MIYNISKFADYKIINFDTRTILKGVRQIDDVNHVIEIYDSEKQELVLKEIKVFGKHDEQKTIFIGF